MIPLQWPEKPFRGHNSGSQCFIIYASLNNYRREIYKFNLLPRSMPSPMERSRPSTSAPLGFEDPLLDPEAEAGITAVHDG
jgi:hypothetical protein